MLRMMRRDGIGEGGWMTLHNIWLLGNRHFLTRPEVAEIVRAEQQITLGFNNPGYSHSWIDDVRAHARKKRLHVRFRSGRPQKGNRKRGTHRRLPSGHFTIDWKVTTKWPLSDFMVGSPFAAPLFRAGESGRPPASRRTRRRRPAPACPAPGTCLC